MNNVRTVAVTNNYPYKIIMLRQGNTPYTLLPKETKEVDARIVEGLSANAKFRHDVTEGWLEINEHK